MNPLRLVILFFLFLPFLSLAQDTETITIKGKVYDADTEEPVSFANVFIKTAMLGTMADTLGKFELILEKKYANDTLFVSAIGYKLYSDLINRLDLSKDVMVEMDDTLIMLSEATALAYDNFEGLYWNTGKSAQPKLLLTCATRYMYNIAGFVKILKSEYGMPKVNANVFKWKNIDIPDLKMKKINITLTYLHCAYCPEETDLNITLALRDSKNRNLLDLRNDAEVLEDYFQSKLNQTFAQGVDYEILEKKGDIMYLKNDEKPYTGK
ncbi:MAG: carboxypeptidase-like regulatory domain-containing protein, partial [Bacteroidota bacterium]